MISAASQVTSASSVAPAVLVVVAIIVVWRFVIFRNAKGTPAGRLLAVVLTGAVGWLLLAMTDPSAAARLAAGTAAGVATLLAAVAGLLRGA